LPDSPAFAIAKAEVFFVEEGEEIVEGVLVASLSGGVLVLRGGFVEVCDG